MLFVDKEPGFSVSSHEISSSRVLFSCLLLLLLFKHATISYVCSCLEVEKKQAEHQQDTYFSYISSLAIINFTNVNTVVKTIRGQLRYLHSEVLSSAQCTKMVWRISVSSTEWRQQHYDNQDSGNNVKLLQRDRCWLLFTPPNELHKQLGSNRVVIR